MLGARPPSLDIGTFDGRDDLALLWDIRVSPAHRGQGVGSALLGALEDAARRGGAAVLRVETDKPLARDAAGHRQATRCPHPRGRLASRSEMQIPFGLA